MDLMLSLHNHAEFSLSRIEPMLLGVPVVLSDQDWAREIFGDDYPLLAKNLTEAYAWVNAFYDDYEKQYARWAEWHQNVLVPKFKPGGVYGNVMFSEISQFIADFEKKQSEYVKQKYANRARENSLYKELADRMLKVPTVFDGIRQLADEGLLEALDRKLEPDDRNSRRITFSTDWNDYRLILKNFYGFVDSGVETGALRRSHVLFSA